MSSPMEVKNKTTQAPRRGDVKEKEKFGFGVTKQETPGYVWAHPVSYRQHKEFQKELRGNPTEAEALLWQHLRGDRLGYRFRFQYIIGDYIVDFVCLPCRLIVEVDGEYHTAEEQQAWDKARTEYLNRCGFQVLRFTNEEVICHLEQTLIQIKSNLKTVPLQQ